VVATVPAKRGRPRRDENVVWIILHDETIRDEDGPDEVRLQFKILHSILTTVCVSFLSLSLKNRGALGDNHFHCFRTNNYKFHFYETKTGLRLLLTTEPGCSDLHEHLRIKIHQSLYVDGVLKRSAAEANAPFESDAFREGLIEWGKRLEYS
jgi:hypothetical protein